MSVTSNNYLYVRFEDSPFPDFFAEGQSVFASTDDPLVLHLSKDALGEEFENIRTNFHFSEIDLCELAQTSIKKSRFPSQMKDQLLGKESPDANSNPIQTGVPLERDEMREDLLENSRLDTYG